jgi:hypothetical protein
VHVNNNVAINFYKKMGFTVLKTVENYYDCFKDTNDAYRMVLKLEPVLETPELEPALKTLDETILKSKPKSDHVATL